jgi:hypothetical protein
VKVYVRDKLAEPGESGWIPKTARVLFPVGKDVYRVRRIPTDVVWHVPATFCALPTDLLNPLLGGAEMGSTITNIGSHACMVRDSAGQTFALTAGHVISTLVGGIPAGLQVKQPLSVGPGVPPSETPLGQTATGFFGNVPDGFLDFALIRLRPGRTGSSTSIDGLAASGQILPPGQVVNDRVQVTKFGAATGRTQAVFSALVNSMVIGGITVTRIFEFKGVPGQAFGGRGDSGALVVSLDPASRGFIVGLLFAVTPPAPDAPGGRGFVFPFGRMSGIQPV